MILEAILASALLGGQPHLPHVDLFLSTPAYSKSFSSGRSSSFSSSSSFSRSSSFSSAPRSSSFSSGSSSSFSAPRSYTPSPKISSPSPSITRINRQVTTPAPRPISAPAIPSTPRVSSSSRTAPTTVVRERYVERDSSGPLDNPFFWMWALDNNRSAPAQAAPPVVVVQDGEAKPSTQVAQPAQVVKTEKEENRALETFAVAALGVGTGVLVMQAFKKF